MAAELIKIFHIEHTGHQSLCYALALVSANKARNKESFISPSFSSLPVQTIMATHTLEQVRHRTSDQFLTEELPTQHP